MKWNQVVPLLPLILLVGACSSVETRSNLPDGMQPVVIPPGTRVTTAPTPDHPEGETYVVQPDGGSSTQGSGVLPLGSKVPEAMLVSPDMSPPGSPDEQSDWAKLKRSWKNFNERHHCGWRTWSEIYSDYDKSRLAKNFGIWCFDVSVDWQWDQFNTNTSSGSSTGDSIKFSSNSVAVPTLGFDFKIPSIHADVEFGFEAGKWILPQQYSLSLQTGYDIVLSLIGIKLKYVQKNYSPGVVSLADTSGNTLLSAPSAMNYQSLELNYYGLAIKHTAFQFPGLDYGEIVSATGATAAPPQLGSFSENMGGIDFSSPYVTAVGLLGWSNVTYTNSGAVNQAASTGAAELGIGFGVPFRLFESHYVGFYFRPSCYLGGHLTFGNDSVFNNILFYNYGFSVMGAF